MCILALTSPKLLRRRRRACIPVTQAKPPTTRRSLNGWRAQLIKAEMKVTATCVCATGRGEARGLMTEATTIHIDVKIDWTVHIAMTHGDLATQEDRGLPCLRGNGLADPAGLMAQWGILDMCILALTSPEPRQRRRRACIPVTRPRVLTIRRNQNTRRTQCTEGGIDDTVTIGVTTSYTGFRGELKAARIDFIDKENGETERMVLTGGDPMTMKNCGLLGSSTRRRPPMALPA
jgi:hypothetical protein